ncbi:hypothetical protein LCGC14_0751410 [marine sediment metagenome]|uniref:Uncharacterized protein n=1 Tax=marine sediment metagenome TaxID=412755 RepID=A0A0F9QNM6_9ZZZZ|nr:MAG: hypothetical protein Lokiarch_07580 [Candidatus Lokiarchaeum sp. GC14_75]
MADDIEIKDGKIFGGWRAPENLARASTTSIHDDDVAKSVGMRGGTIQGTIHLSMFAPLAQKIFGDRWFEQGNVSMYYTFATIDKEEVRAIIELPQGTTEEILPIAMKDVQVKAWAELKNGQQIMTGTISTGSPKEPSYLQSLELKNSKPEDLRILAGYKVGDELPSEEILLTQDAANSGLRRITDQLDYYKGKDKSPWGNAILYPTALFEAMALGFSRTSTDEFKAVPFYGATELRNINGPALIGVPYITKGKYVCIGVSRKTEYFWLDSTLEEKETGKIVASMRHLNRFMKAGSPLYKDQ